MKNLLRLVLLSALLVLAACSGGCVSDHFVGKDGTRFDRTAVGNKTAIQSAEFDPNTGRFKIKGYTNDQTDALTAVTTAFVDALLKALAAPKP